MSSVFGNYMGPTYYHHPTFTCSHYNPASGNTLRTPYLEDINCWECNAAIMEGKWDGVLRGHAPKYYYMSKTQAKKERKRDNAQKRAQEQYAIAHKANGCDCGGIFVERINKATGQKFLGCNRYPNCKKTKPISK